MKEPDTLAEWLRRIQLDWQLGSTEMAALAHVEAATYDAWVRVSREGATAGIPVATVPVGMENAVPLIAIYKRLRAILPDPADQVKWLTQPHAAFDQNRPFDVARSSVQNLFWLSYYLEHAPASGA